MIGARGTITEFFEVFRKRFALPTSLRADIVISVIQNSARILHSHWNMANQGFWGTNECQYDDFNQLTMTSIYWQVTILFGIIIIITRRNRCVQHDVAQVNLQRETSSVYGFHHHLYIRMSPSRKKRMTSKEWQVTAIGRVKTQFAIIKIPKTDTNMLHTYYVTYRKVWLPRYELKLIVKR